jgi:hypothetical protein
MKLPQKMEVKKLEEVNEAKERGHSGSGGQPCGELVFRVSRRHS